MKRQTILTLALSATLGMQAQDGQVDVGTYKLANETQLWRLTQNAAGLTLDLPGDSTANRGIAYFDYSHQSGDLHRVQEGGMNNNLRFFTERYQKIGQYLYGYGSFQFDMGRTKDRVWSDVLRTPASLPRQEAGTTDWGNPFISGSSIPGKYDNQDFRLSASLASVQLGHFTYGASLLYHVGDLSRLRDPRSRINLARYRLTPAVTWTARQHTVGLAAHYDRRKEKLSGLTTVQTDPTLKYYIMTGLENATGTIGGYNAYMREYVNHDLGAELSYGYRSSHFQSLSSLSASHGTEYVYGTNKYEPGRYFNNRFSLTTRNRLQTGRLLHTADLAVGYGEGYADEYRQERLSTTDSITGFNSISWNTVMTYRKRFQQKQFDLDLHYRCTFTGDKGASAYIGIQGALLTVSNKRLLNTSEQNYGRLLVQQEGGARLGQRLWLEAKIGYSLSTKADLTLADATTDYAQAVLLPDQTVLEANYLVGHLQLTYQLPITIEGKTSNWFVRAYGDYHSAESDLCRTQLGCSVGLYY